jgi:hypothetical protein
MLAKLRPAATCHVDTAFILLKRHVARWASLDSLEKLRGFVILVLMRQEFLILIARKPLMPL